MLHQIYREYRLQSRKANYTALTGKAADETHQGVTIYGQEMDNATAALAKMNMILHGNSTAGCALLHP
jgi:type I restriction-modification system DNA methylase subunit